ncbi:MAG: hypothetical protein IPG39_20780 [Bacteroidetes bacterium]|nr:hypothetical protein [Bacteroidota bacterium]
MLTLPIQILSIQGSSLFQIYRWSTIFSSTISGWWCCIHTDIQDIIFDPTNNTRSLAATDGGIFVSSNQGVAWQPSSNGLNCSQYYSFGQGHVDSNFVVGGLQDNGIMYLNTDNNIHTYAGGDYKDLHYAIISIRITYIQAVVVARSSILITALTVHQQIYRLKLPAFLKLLVLNSVN